MPIRRNLFTESVVWDWNRLLRELSHQPWWFSKKMCRGSAQFSGGLGSSRLKVVPGDLRGLLQPKRFCDSMI